MITRNICLYFVKGDHNHTVLFLKRKLRALNDKGEIRERQRSVIEQENVTHLFDIFVYHAHTHKKKKERKKL